MWLCHYLVPPTQSLGSLYKAVSGTVPRRSSPVLRQLRATRTMRKTRLVILPGVRSITQIGCLLLFLACPTIAFKGQEKRDVEPICKFHELKYWWLPFDTGEEENSTISQRWTGYQCQRNAMDLMKRKDKETGFIQQSCNERIISQRRVAIHAQDENYNSKTNFERNRRLFVRTLPATLSNERSSRRNSFYERRTTPSNELQQKIPETERRVAYRDQRTTTDRRLKSSSGQTRIGFTTFERQENRERSTLSSDRTYNLEKRQLNNDIRSNIIIREKREIPDKEFRLLNVQRRISSVGREEILERPSLEHRNRILTGSTEMRMSGRIPSKKYNPPQRTFIVAGRSNADSSENRSRQNTELKQSIERIPTPILQNRESSTFSSILKDDAEARSSETNRFDRETRVKRNISNKQQGTPLIGQSVYIRYRTREQYQRERGYEKQTHGFNGRLRRLSDRMDFTNAPKQRYFVGEIRNSNTDSVLKGGKLTDIAHRKYFVSTKMSSFTTENSRLSRRMRENYSTQLITLQRRCSLPLLERRENAQRPTCSVYRKPIDFEEKLRADRTLERDVSLNNEERSSERSMFQVESRVFNNLERTAESNLQKDIRRNKENTYRIELSRSRSFENTPLLENMSRRMNSQPRLEHREKSQRSIFIPIQSQDFDKKYIVVKRQDRDPSIDRGQRFLDRTSAVDSNVRKAEYNLQRNTGIQTNDISRVEKTRRVRSEMFRDFRNRKRENVLPLQNTLRLRTSSEPRENTQQTRVDTRIELSRRIRSEILRDSRNNNGENLLQQQNRLSRQRLSEPTENKQRLVLRNMQPKYTDEQSSIGTRLERAASMDKEQRSSDRRFIPSAESRVFSLDRRIGETNHRRNTNIVEKDISRVEELSRRIRSNSLLDSRNNNRENLLQRAASMDKEQRSSDRRFISSAESRVFSLDRRIGETNHRRNTNIAKRDISRVEELTRRIRSDTLRDSRNNNREDLLQRAASIDKEQRSSDRRFISSAESRVFSLNRRIGETNHRRNTDIVEKDISRVEELSRRIRSDSLRDSRNNNGENLLQQQNRLSRQRLSEPTENKQRLVLRNMQPKYTDEQSSIGTRLERAASMDKEQRSSDRRFIPSAESRVFSLDRRIGETNHRRNTNIAKRDISRVEELTRRIRSDTLRDSRNNNREDLLQRAASIDKEQRSSDRRFISSAESRVFSLDRRFGETNHRRNTNIAKRDISRVEELTRRIRSDTLRDSRNNNRENPLQRAASMDKEQRWSDRRFISSAESRVFSLDRRIGETNHRRNTDIVEKDISRVEELSRRIRSDSLRDSRNNNRENLLQHQNRLSRQRLSEQTENKQRLVLRNRQPKYTEEQSSIGTRLEHAASRDKEQRSSDRRFIPSAESRVFSLDRRFGETNHRRNTNIAKRDISRVEELTRRIRSDTLRDSRNNNRENLLQRAASMDKEQRWSDRRFISSAESRVFSLDRRIGETNHRRNTDIVEKDISRVEELSRRIRSDSLRESRNSIRLNIPTVQNTLRRRSSPSRLERRENTLRSFSFIQPIVTIDKEQTSSDRRSFSVEPRDHIPERRTAERLEKMYYRTEELFPRRLWMVVLPTSITNELRENSVFQFDDLKRSMRVDNQYIISKDRSNPLRKYEINDGINFYKQLGRRTRGEKSYRARYQTSILAFRTDLEMFNRLKKKSRRNNDLKRETVLRKSSNNIHQRLENHQYSFERTIMVNEISPGIKNGLDRDIRQRRETLRMENVIYERRRQAVFRTNFINYSNKIIQLQRFRSFNERNENSEQRRLFEGRYLFASNEGIMMNANKRIKESRIQQDTKGKENRLFSRRNVFDFSGRTATLSGTRSLDYERYRKDDVRKEISNGAPLSIPFNGREVTRRDAEFIGNQRNRQERIYLSDKKMNTFEFRISYNSNYRGGEVPSIVRLEKDSREENQLKGDMYRRSSSDRYQHVERKEIPVRTIQIFIRHLRIGRRIERNAREREETLVRSKRAFDRRNQQIQEDRESRRLSDRKHVSFEPKFEASLVRDKLGNINRREDISRINVRGKREMHSQDVSRRRSFIVSSEQKFKITERSSSNIVRKVERKNILLGKMASFGASLRSTERNVYKSEMERREEKSLGNRQLRLSDRSIRVLTENRATKSERRINFSMERRDIPEIRDTLNYKELKSEVESMLTLNVLTQKYDEFETFNTQNSALSFPSWISKMFFAMKQAVINSDIEENIVERSEDSGLVLFNKYLPGITYGLQIHKSRPGSEKIDTNKGHLMQDFFLGSVVAGYFITSIHLKIRDYRNVICIF